MCHTSPFRHPPPIPHTYAHVQLDCDFRLARVPPKPADKAEAVLKFHQNYPREVSTRSATYSASNLDSNLPSALLETWRSKGWSDNQTLGVLNELKPATAAALGVKAPGGYTYGTLEGLYSIANTEQVAIVESTSGANPLLWSPARPPVSAGKAPSTRLDGALWDVAALTRAALARCPTARCAIDLMGFLAVSEGFYGGHGTIEELAANGETLVVADPAEAWTFHIAPLPPSVARSAGVPGADGKNEGAHSAVWVAQQVPEDHFTVAANRFTIRDVEEAPPDADTPSTLACRSDTFRHSSNLFYVAQYLASVTPDPKPFEGLSAERRGVRTRSTDGRRVVDFLAHFGGDLNVDMAPYTNDRIFRVLSLFAPTTDWQWPPRTPLATDVYPFSTAPSRPLTRADFLKLARDVYRNASSPSLDLTRGAAAGPYGDPSRYDNPSPLKPPGAGGAFPRAISMFRTSYSHVTEIGRPAPGTKHASAGSSTLGARIWASQGAPHAGIFAPLHVLPAGGVASGDSTLDALPPAFTSGSLFRPDVFDAKPEQQSVWWRTTTINNWARAVGYDYAWGLIERAQALAEAEAEKAAASAELSAESAKSPADAAAVLAAADTAASASNALAHQKLLMTLMASLHDGYRVDSAGPVIDVQKIFYPSWWLEKVGYYAPKLYPCSGACEDTMTRNAFAIAEATAATRPSTTLLASAIGTEAAQDRLLATPDDRLRPASKSPSLHSTASAAQIITTFRSEVPLPTTVQTVSSASTSSVSTDSGSGPASVVLALALCATLLGAASFGAGYYSGRRNAVWPPRITSDKAQAMAANEWPAAEQASEYQLFQTAGND